MHVCRQVRKLLKEKTLIVCADREFIGDKWIKFLLENHIEFYLPYKKNTLLCWQGEQKRAQEWIAGKQELLMDNVKIAAHYLSAGLKRLKGKLGEEELLLVITNGFAYKALSTYQNRWAIEVFFQRIKKRGFHLQDTHLQNADKLRKLFALCAIAFTLCWRIGVWFDEQIKKIKLKNHGYKANSYFRTGLDLLRDALRTNIHIETYLQVIVQTLQDNAMKFKYL